MALIKCTECGHMVSDKAVKCPKCGCPIENQSENVSVGRAQKNKMFWGLIVVVSIVLVVLSVIGFKLWKTEGITSETEMFAPEIKADTNGFISLEQCPTEYPNLRIVLEGEYGIERAKIYKNDILLQVLENEDDVLATDISDFKDPKNVHFMDINFDGYVDIYLGTSESRTKNSIFLWNPASNSFQQGAKDKMLQYLIFEPSTKSLYDGGSGSWCYQAISKYKWEDYSLNELETLEVVSEKSEYEDYGVTHKFTIKNEGGIVSETDDISKLPEKWRALYEKLVS